MKKVASLLLAILMMLSLLAACSGDPATSTAPSSNPSAPASSKPAESDAPVEEDNRFTPDENGEYSIKFPLAEDKVTFSMWVSAPSAGANMVTENDSKVFQKLEALTNVHIEFEHPTLGEEITKFNLMMSSQMYSDTISATPAYYVGGLDKFIDDEVIIPLESYGEYMRNYSALRSQQELSFLSTVTAAGHIPGMFQFRVPSQPSWQGPIIRDDLLGDIGYSKSPDDIKTVADWEEVLGLFKSYSDDIIPYLWPASLNGYNPYFLAPFGLYTGMGPGFFQFSGTIHYIPYEDSFKDYLELMSDWYNKGYFDSEFFNRDAVTTEAIVLKGEAGIATSYKAWYDYANANTLGDGAHWTGIPAPVLNAGDKFNHAYALMTRLLYQGSLVSITVDCTESKIPIILEYFDYLYTDEGSLLANFGKEGETFDYDANGNIVLRDFITRNENGMSFNQMINEYAMFQKFAFRYNWLRTETSISEDAKTIYKKWEANYGDDVTELPAVSVSVDRSNEYANLYNELDTYVKEYAIKVISGALNLETSWTEYKANLENMKVQTVIEIQQEALSAFYSRDTSVGMDWMN